MARFMRDRKAELRNHIRRLKGQLDRNGMQAMDGARASMLRFELRQAEDTLDRLNDNGESDLPDVQFQAWH